MKESKRLGRLLFPSVDWRQEYLMPVDLRETRLPGVGVKYAFRTAQGGRLP